MDFPPEFPGAEAATRPVRFSAELAGARPRAPARATVTLELAGPAPADGPARLAAFLDARLWGRPLDAVVGVPTPANLARYVADWAAKVWPGLVAVIWAGPGGPTETYVPRPRVTRKGL